MKDLILSIVNIFRWTGKIFTVIRNGIFNLFLIFLLVIGIGAFIGSKSSDEPIVATDSGLLLTISGNVVEENKETDPFGDILNEAMGIENPYREVLLQDILDSIHYAAADENITYLLLDLKEMSGVGLPQLATIGTALSNFRDSGKKIIAAEDYFTQNQYYLASYASEIIINPMGGVDLHGFGIYRLYFKDMLDKLKINYHIFRVGTHKSALEPVMRNDMSQEDKEQSKAWLFALWNTFSNDIIKERKLSADAIKQYTDKASSNLLTVGGDTAKLALNMGLVDKVLTRTETRNYLASLSKSATRGKPRTITLNDYLATIKRSYETSDPDTDTIGLIIAQGPILPGEQPAGRIGGDSLAKAIRDAKDDHNIKALVLRIDSGGGSAFASEIIRQELLEFKTSGKSLIVSMGNVAASGGYWIAANADEIWAASNTITGSIGIFGAIPTFEDSLTALGVHGDGIGTTKIASGMNLTQPLSNEISKTIQLSVEHGYDTFLSIVAEGRNLEIEQVKDLANGKVYDGLKAQSIGLVDKIGSLEDALGAAAKHANLEDYSVQYVRKPLTFRERLLRQFKGTVWSFLPKQPKSTILSQISRSMTPVTDLLLLEDPNKIYAHSLIFDTSFQQ